MMRTFGGIDPQLATAERARIWLQSIPYDGTSTWGKGADRGFEAFLHASDNMELYDIETDSEVYRRGIHLLPAITDDQSPERMVDAVYHSVKEQLDHDKFLTYFGGEHSVSIGVMRAFYEKYPGITILHLDAHADLRPEYLGSPFNHACALHTASRNANLIQVGIRSMDISEKEWMDPEKCFWMHDLTLDEKWMDRSIEMMSNQVYITLDLDVLDPGIMPGTGTPEPGGFEWYPFLRYLRKVFNERDVLGFDIVELAPIEGQSHSEFLAAKLYYKMLSYKFEDEE
jgi:agmatinase